jgi:hypothetical protein
MTESGARTRRVTDDTAPIRVAGIAARRVALDGAIVVALAVLCFAQWLPDIAGTALHRDEARWIHRAEYLRELTHPFGDYWDEAIWIDRGGTLDERYRLRAQPPLGSYLMGVGLLAQGRDLDVNGYWNMDRDDAWNAARGNVPAQADLIAARRTTAVITMLTVVAVYAIGARLTNRAGGAAGAVFLALHPLTGLLAIFAGSDTLLALTIALAAVAAWRFADRPTWPRAVLLGVLLGLGGATKLSPLAVALPIGALGMVVLVTRWLGQTRTRLVGRVLGNASASTGWMLFSVPIVAGATFVASYPYLWRAPIEHTKALFDYRTVGMEAQASMWPHLGVETRVEAVERVVRRLGDELTVLGRFGIEVERLELGIAAVGIVVWTVLALRDGLLGARALTFAVLGGAAGVTLAGMQADWARYHLPILLFVSVALGVAVGWAWAMMTGRLREPHVHVKRPTWIGPSTP